MTKNQRGKNYVEPNVRVNLNKDQHELLLSLCGMVLDAPNAMRKMGKYQISIKALPRELKMEILFWKTFYGIVRERQPHEVAAADVVPSVTYSEMFQAMSVREDAGEVKKFLSRCTELAPDDGGIFALAKSLSDWMDEALQAEALRQMHDTIASGGGSPIQKFQKANEIWTAARPREGVSIKGRSSEQLPEWWKNTIYAKRLELASQGRSSGPLPSIIKDRMNPIRPGELGVLAAKSGLGKTTVLIDWAHDFADQGYEVLFIYSETLTESMFDRVVAKAIRVTVKTLQEPMKFNLFGDEPLEKEACEKWEHFSNEYSSKYGGDNARIHFVYAPNVSVSEMEALISQYKAIASASDKELVVVYDYYSLMSIDGLPVGFKASPHEKNNARAHAIKSLAKMQNVRLWTAAQDHMDSDYATGERQTTKAGAVLYEQCQHLVRLKRAIAKEDKKLMRKGKNGEEQAVDTAGEPVFWELKGKAESAATLVCDKTSDSPGGVVQVYFVPAYYSVYRRYPIDSDEEPNGAQS